MHFLFGHGEVTGADVFKRVELELFEADNLAVDADFAVRGESFGLGRFVKASSSLTWVLSMAWVK